MDMLIFAVPLAIVVGPRVYYVIFYLDLYREADGSLNWGAMVRIMGRRPGHLRRPSLPRP